MGISDWLKRRKVTEPETVVQHEPQANNTSSSETVTPRYFKYVSFDDVDELFIQAGRFAIGKDSITTSSIQREFRLGYNRANQIVDSLEAAEVVIKKVGTNSYSNASLFYYVPVMTLQEYAEFLKGCEKYTEAHRLEMSLAHEKAVEAVKKSNLDGMTGEEFEVFCAGLLLNDGFTDVQLTKGSGDRGVDITACKDGVKYVFQCKCYSSSVGNAAVQEVFSGKAIYDADVAVVLTNNYFTEQAKSDAARLRVRLWDRDRLAQLLENSKNF